VSILINKAEEKLLRDLAGQAAHYAALPVQAQKMELWKASNSLRPKRAMVLSNPQNGWDELVPEESVICRDPFLRDLERFLRMQIFRYEYIKDDFPILPKVDIDTVIHHSGYGIENKVISPDQKGGAYHIEPSIKTYADFEKLKPAVIEIDRAATEERLEFAGNLLGDILEVRERGVSSFRCGLTRILIHMRGLDQMMYDVYDNPEFFHEMMSFLRDEMIREFKLYEKENVLSLNNGPDNWNGSGGLAYIDDLPAEDFSGRVRLKDLIAWGESQETVGFSPDQFNEFVLQYQLPILNMFGLTDYGCCEGLDRKLDLIIENIPRLRWVSVSPWCERRVAADKLKNNYVYVYKPIPTPITSGVPDYEYAESLIRETLEIAEGCSVQIVLKDTSTFCNEPERLTIWSEMAVRVAEEMA
jgi:hypothetical protein